MFDELGLYTAGRPPSNTVGTQTVKLLNKNVNSNTGLATSFQYTFKVAINGGAVQDITITTPSAGTGVSGGSTFINYADLLVLLNAKLNPYGVSASITDAANGVETNGNLVFSTLSTGPNATIAITTTSLPSNWLFNHLLDYDSVAAPVNGQLAGVQNNAADPSTERERLLTH
ncbi:hypothetical protein, partial [Enterococcus faecalis]|uniref:hypothetical protein n=1 Tax=Enterococcus faecalis TaxID=1351 RepID=UPI001E386C14